MLQATHLYKSYGRTVAVRDVSFAVHTGEVLGLLGSNGAGKSTTVRMLAGLAVPDHGTALVGGHDVVRDPVRAKAALGYLPETVVLYDRLTLREYLRRMKFWTPQANLKDFEKADRESIFKEAEQLLRDQLGEAYVEWARERCFPEPAPVVVDEDALDEVLELVRND